MAQKDSFDDVLGNKFNLLGAKSSQLLSSWMGHASTTPAPTHISKDTTDEDADLKQSDFGHDRLGVGSAIPKDIADGTFTRRAPTSNDKLLEQLLGKKRAKAHLAAKQEAERASARQQPTWQQQQQQQQGKQVQKSEESEDEEEGRASVIASKRQKSSKARSVEALAQDADEPREDGKEDGNQDGLQEEKNVASDDDIDLKPKKRVKKSRRKPTSYLDELLAERSKKKKGKGKGAEDI